MVGWLGARRSRRLNRQLNACLDQPLSQPPSPDLESRLAADPALRRDLSLTRLALHLLNASTPPPKLPAPDLPDRIMAAVRAKAPPKRRPCCRLAQPVLGGLAVAVLAATLAWQSPPPAGQANGHQVLVQSDFMQACLDEYRLAKGEPDRQRVPGDQ